MPIRQLEERYVYNEGVSREGNHSFIYQARDLHPPGRDVAIKVLKAQASETELARELFLRETESLSALEHPNIVELISSGVTAGDNQYYLVLEWIDSDLLDHCRNRGPLTWDEYASEYFEPILKSLAFAHAKRIVHRDITPRNILVTPEGVPKLVDFGVARILDSVRLGLTVRDFVSRPYAPPERNFDQPTRDDVFSIGVTTLACLLPDTPITYENLADSIESLDIDPATRKFLARLTSFDPHQRPLDGRVALAELRDLQAARRTKMAPSFRLHLAVPARLSYRFEAAMDCEEGNALKSSIEGDLGGPAYATPRISGQNVPREAYQLLGRRFIYDVEVDPQKASHLVLSRVRAALSIADLDDLKQNALPLSVRCAVGTPGSLTEGQDSVRQFRDLMSEFESERRVLRRLKEEQATYGRWSNFLNAQAELERLKESPINYAAVRLSGSRAVFRCERDLSDDMIGEERRVKAGRHVNVAGIVERIDGRELTLRLEPGEGDVLPRHGTLVVAGKSGASIRRQRKALEDIRNEVSARPEWRKLLAFPEDVAPPKAVKGIRLIQEDLDEAKQAALAIVLGADDITAVQGPPGTGKTTLIAETICQFVERGKGRRVLLTGQTHTAVDNALSKVKKLRSELKVLRVGKLPSDEAREYSAEREMERWRAEAAERAHAFLRRWALERGLSQAHVEVAERIVSWREARARLAETASPTAAPKSPEGQQERTSDRLRGGLPSSPPVPDESSVPSSTEHDPGTFGIPGASEGEDIQMARLLGDKARKALQSIESSLLSMLGLRDTADASVDVGSAIGEYRRQGGEEFVRLEQLCSEQHEWLQRFRHTREFVEALMRRADVVAGTCVGFAREDEDAAIEYGLVVIDEASKATPPEALVPISRGRRCVIVGDPCQLPPFVDDALERSGILDKYEMTTQDLERTLFDHLWNRLPEKCRSTLYIQHRMIRPIGDLISACFYGNDLRTEEPKPGPLAIDDVLPRRVTWFTTSGLGEARRDSKSGNSFCNPEEATHIASWLGRLEWAARKRSERFKVGVVSGYGAQKQRLINVIRPDDRLRWKALEIEVDTVDAFQGREVAVLVYSVTRSNRRGAVGFLKSKNRLNVALSRGQYGLVVFGDHEHCLRARDRENPSIGVLRYMRDNPDDCAIEDVRWKSTR